MADLVVAALRAGELVVDTAVSVYGRFRGSTAEQNRDERASPASDDESVATATDEADEEQ
ncbi:uncharacterized protein Nmag_1401 [Natrialba magadii ATCC 43099]|uniref:Uncharacterized protein n=1 Tax=Natrialba magadii (strain ATCC 43099 / DSM 3394 / CCM 3739 / CIP 104546 / IAM 13178 / JCM 8861 / NBRC 102185 / NCIMB 2190 / MS3) TaxID=547559 RepID=D3ST34_NATMM|nr:hypothetical protein [Natrialba magadii]ADD04980.1 uncharacterized protein Nmag_1401 [Natrialba magadii ATCC 43099]ELY24026.1 hypothetical protein C500_19520 [Natrialba magadii ATCC 43099]